jgi:hypothetical protein
MIRRTTHKVPPEDSKIEVVLGRYVGMYAIYIYIKYWVVLFRKVSYIEAIFSKLLPYTLAGSHNP